VPTWNPRCRLRNASVMGSRGWSPTAMIWQGCFQSFIKRIVKILWAIIAIPKKGAFQELPSQADCVKKFPPCLCRSGYAQAGIKLSLHPRRITTTDKGGITGLLLIRLTNKTSLDKEVTKNVSSKKAKFFVRGGRRKGMLSTHQLCSDPRSPYKERWTMEKMKSYKEESK